MEWQGVLGWLMALGGLGLWLWEAYKVIQRQRVENEKMKELLQATIKAMQNLYQSHENALTFYRGIVTELLHRGSTMAAKKEKAQYVVKVAGKQYADEDPIEAIRKARNGGGVDGGFRLQGFFTAPRRLGKVARE